MRRRTVLLAVPGVALLGWGVWQLEQTWRHPTPVPLNEGCVVGPAGRVHVVPPGHAVTYVPGTRVPAADWAGTWQDAPVLADGDRLVLESAASARVSGARLPEGRWADLARQALADLVSMTGPELVSAGAPSEPRVSQVARYPAGAVVAGPVTIWRYVWPRDSAFAAVAYAAVGLVEEAVAVLEQLARWQGQDGSFEARFTADGAAPDGRSAQDDGPGWVAWAVGRVLAAAQDAEQATEDSPAVWPAQSTEPDGGGGTPSATARVAGSAESVRHRLIPVLARSAAYLLTLTDTEDGLPLAGPDYWEVAEDTVTLGLAAPVLLGLEAVASVAGSGSDHLDGLDPTTVTAVRERVPRLRSAIEDGFAPGWGRHLGGDDVDAAIALVLPPFTAEFPGAQQVREGAVEAMVRLGGGVAPGSGWRDDGVSWTPETALLAWSAVALGRWEEAERLLGWLEEHRTACGSLPEKVLADGSAAGPAPLAWTAALVLLSLAQLGPRAL